VNETCCNCGHTDPHSGGGLGVCLSKGCGCDGQGPEEVWKKSCSRCGEWKIREEFYTRLERGGNADSYCKSCRTEIRRETRERNPEPAIKAKETFNQRKSHERKEIKKDLLLLQGGRCALCGTILTPETGELDHDHTCCAKGCIPCVDCRRSVLCHLCNHGLGFFKEDINLLIKAVHYLDVYGNR